MAARYPPNRRGIYDLIGNVAEMIDEKGKTKGGSWDSFLEECKLDTFQTFKEPDPTVGFRWVMEVIEK